ncbi:YoaK family protein [Aureimonas populi]|uniref:YoaK family protein n=1 Tax=Aureimonas populi TaxID=1701758 RepID=A0ABW5CIB3_9HYPH|nr:YoaK family protein [Aureimonas populi]
MNPRARRHRRLRRTRFGLGLALTLSLAFAAGMTDAIGLILVGRYVSFMSGNTTQLGVSLVEGDGGSGLFLAAILACFVAGNALGEIVMRAANRRHSVLLTCIALLVAMPVFLGVMPWAILPAVVGMGMLNAGVEQIDGHAFGITFVTGALSRFGRGLGRRLMGDRNGAWRYQLVPWLGMFAGALAGAFSHAALGQNALLASAGACILLALVSHAIPATWRRGYVSPARPARRG